MTDGPDERQRLAQQAIQARPAASAAPTVSRPLPGVLPSPTATSAATPGPRRTTAWLGTLAIGAGAAALAFWFTATPAQSDSGLTAAQQAARVAAFASLGALSLPVVPEPERAQALASMDLPADQQQALTQDLAQTRTALVYVTLWDDQAEDGDVVAVSSQGFTRQVGLTHAPQRLAVPVGADGITVRGVRDGGGGITLAAQAAQGPVLVPVLAPGQSLLIPVALP